MVRSDALCWYQSHGIVKTVVKHILEACLSGYFHLQHKGGLRDSGEIVETCPLSRVIMINYSGIKVTHGPGGGDYGSNLNEILEGGTVRLPWYLCSAL